MKGAHILDPRTGLAAQRRNRVWALTESAAESDALSTAAMVLSEMEITEVVGKNPDWLVFIHEEKNWRQLGTRPLPPMV